MKNKLLILILPIASIVLEALPYGAVCHFATPEERESVRRTYSYFDLTPYGYANFGPFLTALCTVALLLIAVVFFLREGRGYLFAIRFLSLAGTFFSVMPLMFGLRYYTVSAGIISLCLAVLSIVAFKTKA